MRFTTRFTLALLGALVCSGALLAAADAAARFTFVVPYPPESTLDADRLTLTLNRWSTDAERDEMLRVMKESGTEDLLTAFRDTAAVGYLRWPGGLEYSVRYARRTERADRGSDVVLVVERPLWVWWDVPGAEQPESADKARFTVVQLRLDAKGRGEGRISSSTTVASDASQGVLVPDFANRPALLLDVQQESESVG